MPLDDNVADINVDVRAPPPRSRLTSCLEPLYRPDAAALSRFLRFYRLVGVERFVLWDGERALASLFEAADDGDVAYNNWTFTDLMRTTHVKTSKGGPIGQHLAMAYCAFVYGGDDWMLLSVDLDELISCDTLETTRDIVASLAAAAAAAGEVNPCRCLQRWLFDEPLSDGAIPTSVVARQLNRKCVVAPGRLQETNFHRPKCENHRGIFAVDAGRCWINHYRNQAISGKQPLDAHPLPDGPARRTDLGWAASVLLGGG